MRNVPIIPNLPVLPFSQHHVLVAPDRLLLLNSTAHLVWELHSEGLPQEEISSLICSELGVSADTVNAEIANCLNAFNLPSGTQLHTPPVTHGGTLITAPETREKKFRTRRYQLGEQYYQVGFDSRALEESAQLLLAHLEVPKLPEQTQPVILSICYTEPNYVLAANDGRNIQFASSDEVVASLHAEILDQGYKSMDHIVALHAGAVSSNNRCLLFPGKTGSGKSSLVAALAASGLEYMGDDVVPLAGDPLQAWPLPLSLNLKSTGLGALEHFHPGIKDTGGLNVHGRQVHYLNPADAGMTIASGSVPVSRVIFPVFSKEGSNQYRDVEPTGALQRMIESEALFERPLVADKIQIFLRWLEQTPASVLEFNDLQWAVERVLPVARG